MAEPNMTNPQGGVNISEAAELISNIDLDATDVRRVRPESGEDLEPDPTPEQPDEIEDSGDEEDQEVEETESSAEEDSAEPDETESDLEESDEIIQDLAQFAEWAEIPEEQLLDLKAKAKVNGQDLEITLKEALEGYQRGADYTQGKQELSNSRKQFDSEVQQAQKVYERNNAILANMMQQLAAFVEQPPNPQEMARLREEDQSEFLIRQSEHQQRVQAFQQLVQQASQQYAEAEAHWANHTTGQLQQMLASQEEVLQGAIPGWGQERKSELQQFAADKYDVPVDESNLILDPRIWRAMSDLKAFHEGKDNSTVAQKRLREVPGVKSPGKRKSRTRNQLRADQVKSLKAKARSSNKLTDVAAAIEASLKDL